MVSAISTILELAGFAVLAYGFWLLEPWLGLVTAGGALILIGYAIDRPPRKST